MNARKPRFIAFFSLLLLTSGASAQSPHPGKTPSPWIHELQNRLETQPSAVGCHGSLYEPDKARCQKLEETIRTAKALDLESSADFVSVVRGRLEEIRDAQSYSYAAVLLAALSRDRRFTAPLERLAKIEKGKKIPFHYGQAALEMIRDGHCSAQSAREPNLGEICSYEDPDFNRLRHYTGAR